MMNLIEWIKYTGIWMQPLVMAGSLKLIETMPYFDSHRAPSVMASLGLSAFSTAYTRLWNRRDRKNYKKKQLALPWLRKCSMTGPVAL